MTEHEQIEAGRRVEQFLADDAVKGAISKLNDAYYLEFKSATDDADMQRAWAKARVMEDFALSLRSIMDNGTVAKARQEVQEKEAQVRRVRDARFNRK